MPFRDEMIISSKAGYLMWPGPYGEWGSRKYLVASCDQSLARMGLKYVDIFYSHRFDPDTPLEETMGALDYIVRSGRALYAGISSYNAEQTARAAKILKDARHALPDPPAQLQHVQPLDRGRAHRRARQGTHRLHRVLAAGAGPADQQIPERHSRRFPRRETHLARSGIDHARRRSRRSRSSTSSRRAAVSRWRRWPWRGRCGTRR